MSAEKHIAEQIDIDFDQPLHHVPEHLLDPEREQAERTEYYAMCWFLGFENHLLWNDLPNYERRRIVLLYMLEEDRQERFKLPLKRTYARAQAEVDGWYQQNLEIAQRMAEVLKEDFKLRRPCSYIMLPQYQWLLDWAFDLAQVPNECVAEAKMEVKS